MHGDMKIKSLFDDKEKKKMRYNTLVKRIDEFGIFKNFVGLFNVVNLETMQITKKMNFITLIEAEEYIACGVTY